MTSTQAFEALRAAAVLGPYFAVDCGPADAALWLPFTDLLTDPSVCADRVATARDVIGRRTGVADVDERACASVYFLGLVSRIVAPPLAAVALTGTVPVTHAADLRWQRVDAGPVPMASMRASAHRPADPQHAAALLHDLVVAPLVEPVVGAFGNVSSIVRWGNVASALAGAASTLSSSGSTYVFDPLVIAHAALQQGPLIGTGRFDATGRFRRTSCCLYYRLPGGGVCGDCVLAG